jgi:GT2 family glycosyltransferase/glycosyltransferase involved in cell wall biosynthesis/SAM-dependent methyltransferase
VSNGGDGAASAIGRVIRSIVGAIQSRRRAHSSGGQRRAWWVDTPWDAIRSSGLFDGAWYCGTYADVDASDPLRHFATTGSNELRDPNAMFATRWYLTTYPDVAAAGVDPLVHYLEHGSREGRNPSPLFNTDWYLRSNPDVHDSGLNPLAHYLVAGEKEGRPPRPLRGRPLRPSSITVTLVSGEPSTPGHEYRVLRFAEAVEALGGVARVRTLPESASERIADIDDADVVLLWRTTWCGELERVVPRARRAGAVLLFDVDDLMIDPHLATVATIDGIRSQRLTEEEVKHWYALMRRTAKESAACTCTTRELARHLRGIGRPSYVLPNGFSDASLTRSRLAVRLRRQTTHDGLCRIGYATGSRTHQRDFALVAEPLAGLLRANDACRFVVYRDALDLDEFPIYDELRGQVEFRDVVPLDLLPLELARLDISLAPVEVGNPFCEAKSALKFFEAALVDVPTIASPTEPFRSAITHGVNGLLASDASEWSDALSKLSTDETVRRAMGSAARTSVMWTHGPERRAQTVKAVLEQLVDGEAVAADAFALELRREADDSCTPPRLGNARVVMETDRLREARVTVAVPVHNYQDFVIEALESVRAQTVADLDLVVTDDCSTDNSLERVRFWLDANCKRFNRVVLLAHTENSGLARTRNSCFDAAETTFVLPLDADNRLLPECCERLSAALEHSAAVFAYPRIQHFGATSELFPPNHVRGYLPYAPQRLVGSNYIDAMALIRKSAWLAAGGYRDGLMGWEDYDLWCRLAERGLYGVQVPEDLAAYRVHQASMLHSVTHRGDRLAEVEHAMTRAHPWLSLESASPVEPAVAVLRTPASTERPRSGTASTSTAPDPPVATDGRLSDRSRRLLPIMRCPATGERLEERPGGGLRTTGTGRVWPVVQGRPVLFEGMVAPTAMPPDHVGNPLPPRLRQLITQLEGMGLHLSGGGTGTDAQNVVELDAALFGPTDVVADAHHLPFADDTFALVVAMNAFEHYRQPVRVAEQIERVLTPGGLVFVHTAFLQPEHETPNHYFNCTRYGLEQWFNRFETVDLRVSENFHPGYALSWIASDVEDALARDVSPPTAAAFRNATLGTFSDFWRDPSTRTHPHWHAFSSLSPDSLGRLAAGFEYVGRLPH